MHVFLVSAVWPPLAVGLVISLRFIGEKADLRCRYRQPAVAVGGVLAILGRRPVVLLRPCLPNCRCANLIRKARSAIYPECGTPCAPVQVAAGSGWSRRLATESDQPLGGRAATRGSEFKTGPRRQKGSTERSPDRRARWMAASRSSPLPRKATAKLRAEPLFLPLTSAGTTQTPNPVTRCPASLVLILVWSCLCVLCRPDGRRPKPRPGWSLPRGEGPLGPGRDDRAARCRQEKNAVTGRH